MRSDSNTAVSCPSYFYSPFSTLFFSMLTLVSPDFPLSFFLLSISLALTHIHTHIHANTHTHTHTHTHFQTHAHTSAIMADTLLFHGGCFPPCFPSAVCLIKADLRGPQRFLCLCVLKGSFQRLPSTAQSN